MILDKLDNLALYADAIEPLRPVMEYIQSNDLRALPDGRTEIDGDRLFVLVSHGNTEPWADRKFEGHYNYIDVQCVLAGNEIMGYANTADLTVTDAYDPVRDILFFDEPHHCSNLAVTEGMFVVFFPRDAHKPCCVCGQQTQVQKAVFKIKL